MVYRRLFIVLLSALALGAQAITKVSLEQLQRDGWEQYKGQRVHITTPLVVCACFYDSLILAPERLYVPEERAVGLDRGDSTVYWHRVAYNRAQRIKLVCRKPYDLNLGATVSGLEAYVMGERSLQTGKQPNFKNYKPLKKLPNLGNPDIVVCASNIQNFFYHQGGYATKRNTAGQHALQCYKVASALLKLNADLYALCEIEKGPSAPKELVEKMNELTRKDLYDYVQTDERDGDTISVGFVYRKDRIQPNGQLCFAYNDRSNIYARRFMLQGFETTGGEKFVVSLNHLRSKRGNPQMSNAKRMDNIARILSSVDSAYAERVYTDPDILFLGDYNCYRYEEPIQTIVKAGYVDMLAGDSLTYSYSYKGECGSLDRVFASPTMAAQITGVAHIHWNTDYYYSAAYYSRYNYKNNTVPKEAPANICKCLSKAAKCHLLFRYSDHDPVLIGLKLKTQ